MLKIGINELLRTIVGLVCPTRIAILVQKAQTVVTHDKAGVTTNSPPFLGRRWRGLRY
jgi:hypothetical protein